MLFVVDECLLMMMVDQKEVDVARTNALDGKFRCFFPRARVLFTKAFVLD